MKKLILYLLKLKQSTDNQSQENLKFKIEVEPWMLIDQVKKYIIKHISNLWSKEKTFKLKLTEEKIRQLIKILLLNQQNIIHKIEYKLFKLQLNKSLLNHMFNNMYMKRQFIMFRILLLEEFLFQDLFRYQHQYLIKYQLLEEFLFLLLVKRIEELKF